MGGLRFEKLTDLDFLGVQLEHLVVQVVEPPLDPARPPEHRPCLQFDAQKDVAGIPGELGELLDDAGESVTAHLVQRREHNKFSDFASPGFSSRFPAVPGRQPARAPRLHGPLMKGHIQITEITSESEN